MRLDKKTFFAFMLIGMLGITSTCYAETSSGKSAMNEVKQETQYQRDEVIRKTKAALDNLDKRIDTLEASVDKNWDKMNKAAHEKARDNLKSLRKQRIQAAEWYGSLKNSAGDAWKHMEKGFSDAYKTLNAAWEKSEKEFRAGK